MPSKQAEVLAPVEPRRRETTAPAPPLPVRCVQQAVSLAVEHLRGGLDMPGKILAADPHGHAPPLALVLD